ncbi:HNH endonuclease [Bacillus safensis]|uniref:HNH endonuclease n=1 Tax=Bacillus safensis TaxID=561879 RepID=UPI0035115CBF
MKKKKNGIEYIYFRPDCKECVINKSKIWIIENKEQFKNTLKKYKQKPELKMKQRLYNQKWRDNGGLSDWQAKNKDMILLYAKNREKKNHKISKMEWENCKNYFNNCCAYCGFSEEEHMSKFRQGLHRDHVNNLGENDLSNCVPACKACNSSKGVKELIDWLQDNFHVERCSIVLMKINAWIENDHIELITEREGET